MAGTPRTTGGNWRTDPYLQGVAMAALTSAMRGDSLARFSATVQELRRRGADLETLYPAVRTRFPEAPTLDDLERKVGRGKA